MIFIIVRINWNIKKCFDVIEVRWKHEECIFIFEPIPSSVRVCVCCPLVNSRFHTKVRHIDVCKDAFEHPYWLVQCWLTDCENILLIFYWENFYNVWRLLNDNLRKFSYQLYHKSPRLVIWERQNGFVWNLKKGGILLKSGYQFRFWLKSDKHASIFSESPTYAFAQIYSAAV